LVARPLALVLALVRTQVAEQPQPAQAQGANPSVPSRAPVQQEHRPFAQD
jgi:hypothetical protein